MIVHLAIDLYWVGFIIYILGMLVMTYILSRAGYSGEHGLFICMLWPVLLGLAMIVFPVMYLIELGEKHRE